MVYFSCVVANRRDAWLIGKNDRGSGDRWQMTWANIVTLDGGVWVFVEGGGGGGKEVKPGPDVCHSTARIHTVDRLICRIDRKV